MNASERIALIEKVQQLTEEVKASILEYKELTQPIAPDDAIGRVSRMDAINNKAVNDEALRKAEARLRGLVRIMDKREDLDLGICDRCKKGIPMARLLLVPESTKCVHCAAR